jgi:uncharacterized protein YabE (DUF348 family)
MIDLRNYNAKLLQKFFSNHLRVTIFTVGLAVLVSVFAFKMQKSVAIMVDGKPTKISTYSTTVGRALETAGIGVGKRDKVTPALDISVTNDMIIRIERAIPVNIAVDGKGLVVYTAEKTIGTVLKTSGINLNKSDIVSPGTRSPVYKNMKIAVTRIAENTVTMTKKVAYKVLSKSDANFDKGKVKVLRQGSDGVNEVRYKVIYKDGIEAGRFLIGEVVKKSPVDKLVAVGSLAWFSPSKTGRKVYFTKQFRVKATSYTADYACTGKRPGDRGFGITATGAKAKRNVNSYSTVAVDTSVIPLGTKLYIEGYGYAIAEDVGGGVNGKHVDLYFTPGSQEYRSWFTHKVNVYVLK